MPPSLRCASLAALLAFTAMGEGQPYKLYDFKLRGSDGRQYTLKTLTAGKPVLVFNLKPKYVALRVEGGAIVEHTYKGFEAPNRIADLNRLSAMTRGKLRVVGLVELAPGPAPLVRRLAKETGCKFLLLGDDKPYSAHPLINQMTIDGRLRMLQNMLILANGKAVRTWPGYNRDTLRQMVRDVRRHAGISLRLDLSKFPKALQAGGGSMYGLPPP